MERKELKFFLEQSGLKEFTEAFDKEGWTEVETLNKEGLREDMSGN